MLRTGGCQFANGSAGSGCDSDAFVAVQQSKRPFFPMILRSWHDRVSFRRGEALSEIVGGILG